MRVYYKKRQKRKKSKKKKTTRELFKVPIKIASIFHDSEIWFYCFIFLFLFSRHFQIQKKKKISPLEPFLLSETTVESYSKFPHNRDPVKNYTRLTKIATFRLKWVTVLIKIIVIINCCFKRKCWRPRIEFVLNGNPQW